MDYRASWWQGPGFEDPWNMMGILKHLLVRGWTVCARLHASATDLLLFEKEALFLAAALPTLLKCHNRGM
jgi:hypothetical protein